MKLLTSLSVNLAGGIVMCDVTSCTCNNQCADKHGSCGVLNGVLNLQYKLVLLGQVPCGN